MPILVRPVREQIEHDRVIRQLQTKWRRKFKVDANVGEERTASVKVGATQLFPDLVLTQEGGKKPTAVIEVETGESVNHLEAMSQWASFAKSRIPFYLFVPGGSLDAARRLCADHQIDLTELWTYLVLGDQIRFTSVFRSPSATSPESITEKAEPARSEPAPPKRREPAPAPAPAPVGAAPSPSPPPAPARPRRKAAAPAPPPRPARRKAAAPAKRAAAAKRPARGTAKRAPVRRAAAAAKARPATKRAAQKRK